ncbi:hypothetical protein PHOSAC3_120071 [Mesotoga infera]|nr:hypothetical protein PHOSAC3_120071 [Mesotoga infera]
MRSRTGTLRDDRPFTSSDNAPGQDLGFGLGEGRAVIWDGQRRTGLQAFSGFPGERRTDNGQRFFPTNNMALGTALTSVQRLLCLQLTTWNLELRTCNWVSLATNNLALATTFKKGR